MIPPQKRASDHLNVVTESQKTMHISTEEITTPPSKNSQPQNLTNNISSIFGDGLVGINNNGEIYFINKIACKLTGWTQNEAEGQLFEKIFQLNSHSASLLGKSLVSLVINSGQLISPVIEQEIKTKNNEVLLINFSISPLDGNSAILMFHQSKSENSHKILALPYHVNYDPLTRLLNRASIREKINNIHHLAQAEERTYSILLLNIDRFKLINERYGQANGDTLLQYIAEQIQSFIRDNDILGRWAGEEFLCVLPDTPLKYASIIAERLCNNINEHTFIVDDQPISISTSIGIANYPFDVKTAGEIFCSADAALYEAKMKGRNRVQKNNLVTKNIFSICTQLETALNNRNIVSVHQPIVDLQNEKPVARETLARIQKTNGDLIPAGNFIDAAVKMQLVHRIDHRIIRSAIMRCCIDYSKNGFIFPHFVNISADLLRRPELVEEIVIFAQQAFSHFGLDKQDRKPLVIEITEQELLHDINDIRSILAPFTEMGLELAIDDFGSGYSSLTYLSDLPITYLKYDGSLIKRISNEKRTEKIITGIQRMAETLNLITIAEHIEDEKTLNILRDIGVSWGQGYYFGKPVKKINY